LLIVLQGDVRKELGEDGIVALHPNPVFVVDRIVIPVARVVTQIEPIGERGVHHLLVLDTQWTAIDVCVDVVPVGHKNLYGVGIVNERLCDAGLGLQPTVPVDVGAGGDGLRLNGRGMKSIRA
jgi:hypothetical protein